MPQRRVLPGLKAGRIAAAMAVFFMAPGLVSAAFDPAFAFEKKCSSCHTIGGGVMKGPDLKDVGQRRAEDWLIRFIQSSADVIASGDPAAAKLFNEFDKKEMPDHRLSVAEIRELLAFIASGGAGTKPVAAKSALEAKPEDIAEGRRLFFGEKPFANGAPPCKSCHDAGDSGGFGGGTLAKNLTTAYSVHKDQGLSTALRKMSLPVMQEVFGAAPLTDEESFRIKAFLYSADKRGLMATGDPQRKKFLFLGLGGTALSLGVIDFAWRKRRKASVRRDEGGLR